MNDTSVKSIAMTVDLEDWFDGLQSVAGQSTVQRDTEFLLAAFSEFNVLATFFALADIAEKQSKLILMIAESGHEIGFHGGAHDFVYKKSPETFRGELHRGKACLEDLTGKPVIGFRAPFFSITKRTCWAVDSLVEAGFEYDSSVYPAHNDRYGWPGTPIHPFRFMPSGLLEFPVPLIHRFIPLGFSGGAYLRILPWWFVRRQFIRYRHSDVKGMIYIHPWEYSGNIPRIWKNNIRAGLTRYPGLKGIRRRLKRILSEYSDILAPMSVVIRELDDIQEFWPQNSMQGVQ